MAEKTVYTRIDRALEKLRSSLDSREGGREKWLAAVAPLCLDPSPIEVGAATVAGSGATAATIGGTTASVKLSAIVVSAAVAMFIGWGARALIPSEPAVRPSPSHVRSNEDRSRLIARLDASRDRVASLDARREELQLARSALAAERTTPGSSESARTGTEGSGFGRYASLPEVANANWAELSRAATKVQAGLASQYAAALRGEQPDPAAVAEIRSENAKLVYFAATIIGKIPTSASFNGEFSHPTNVAHLAEGMLDLAEHPLSREQHEEFERICSEFDRAFELTRASYDGSTPKVTRVVDEFELKHEAKLAFERELETEQLDALIAPHVRNRHTVDLLSPFMMLQTTLQPVRAESRDELRDVLPSRFASYYAIPVSALTPLRPEFDRWVDELGPNAAPRDLIELHVLGADEALRNGHAHARVVEAALRYLDLEETTRSKLLEDEGWFVPQISKAP